MGNYGKIKNCHGKNSYQSNLILSVCIHSNTNEKGKKTDIYYAIHCLKHLDT